MHDPVTTRYAEALFRLARSEGALDAVRADVERLARALDDPKVRAVLFDASIPREKRRAQARALLGGVHRFTKNLVELLFAKHREQVLADLGTAFRRRVLEHQGVAEGVVESARPLERAELERLERALGPRLSKQLALENRLAPELLGGVRVIVGSRMIDASVAGRLEALKKRLMGAPLPRAT
jgi:F-type H+-transporting ATPase subunit delta